MLGPYRAAEMRMVVGRGSKLKENLHKKCFSQNEEPFKRSLILGSVLFRQTHRQQGLGHFRPPLLALGQPQDNSHLG